MYASPARHLGLVLTVALALVALPGKPARADEVYKSVGADGNVTYSDRENLGTAPPGSVEVLNLDAPPRVIHVCWTNCFTLLLRGDVYVRADGSDESWTVERFTSRSVTLHRHDPAAQWNGYNTDVKYSGQVIDDRLFDGAVGGRPVPDIQMAWGSALDTLPGSNAERDRWKAMGPAQAPPLAIGSDAAGTWYANDPPPPLPEFDQPPCTVDGYVWTPGYWAWGSDGYYWVAGAWVAPPRVGLLWTPGFWAFADGRYRFSPGYWSRHVGYYGGINYGFGYGGIGFVGGRWVGNTFLYNTVVSHVDKAVIQHTYAEPTSYSSRLSRVSYNGGSGGVSASPTAAERSASVETHYGSKTLQRQITPSITGRAGTADSLKSTGAQPQSTALHTGAEASSSAKSAKPAKPVPPTTAHSLGLDRLKN
jgi:hypothetical protein